MIDFLISTGICFVIATVIAVGWASGIHNMHKNNPDYKGEDFLNWNEDEKDSSTR